MMVDVTAMTPHEWEAWKAKALAAGEQRKARLAMARARRQAHAPCDDPFCPWCVPFGRHLDVGVQQRRRAVWAQQDRERAGERIERLRAAEVGEAAGFLHDLALLRKAAGLTQGTLAAKVGIKRESLSRIEAGKAIPRRPVVDRLRAALAPVRTGSGLPRKAGQRGALDARSRPSPSGGHLDPSSRETSQSGRAQRQHQGELAEPLEDHRRRDLTSPRPGGTRPQPCPMPGGQPNDAQDAW